MERLLPGLRTVQEWCPMSQIVIAAGRLALPCQARAALAKGRKAPGNYVYRFLHGREGVYANNWTREMLVFEGTWISVLHKCCLDSLSIRMSCQLCSRRTFQLLWNSVVSTSETKEQADFYRMISGKTNVPGTHFQMNSWHRIPRPLSNLVD